MGSAALHHPTAGHVSFGHSSIGSHYIDCSYWATNENEMKENGRGGPAVGRGGEASSQGGKASQRGGRRQRKLRGRRKKNKSKDKIKNNKNKEQKKRNRKNSNNKGRKRNMSKGKKGSRNSLKRQCTGDNCGRSESNSTCSGSSVGDTCLSSLITAMKFERDKISSFNNQKKRAEAWNRLIDSKASKKSVFGNTTSYLLVALGGNISNLACPGDNALTNDATKAYRTLTNCSTAITSSCSVPNNTVDFTQLDKCQATFKEIAEKNAACLAMTTDGAAACECWEEAKTLTEVAKRQIADCDSKSAQAAIKSLRMACVSTFSQCKKAEDSSVGYVMICSQDTMAANSSRMWDNNLLASASRIYLDM